MRLFKSPIWLLVPVIGLMAAFIIIAFRTDGEFQINPLTSREESEAHQLYTQAMNNYKSGRAGMDLGNFALAKLIDRYGNLSNTKYDQYITEGILRRSELRLRYIPSLSRDVVEDSSKIIHKYRDSQKDSEKYYVGLAFLQKGYAILNFSPNDTQSAANDFIQATEILDKIPTINAERLALQSYQYLEKINGNTEKSLRENANRIEAIFSRYGQSTDTETRIILINMSDSLMRYYFLLPNETEAAFHAPEKIRSFVNDPTLEIRQAMVHQYRRFIELARRHAPERVHDIDALMKFMVTSYLQDDDQVIRVELASEMLRRGKDLLQASPERVNEAHNSFVLAHRLALNGPPSNEILQLLVEIIHAANSINRPIAPNK